MRRPIAVVLVAALGSGCLGLTRKHRGTAVAADVAAIGGLLLVAKNAGCQERPAREDPWDLDCIDADLGVGAGIALIAVGLTLGAWLLDKESDSPAAERVGAPIVTVTPGPVLPDLPAGRVDSQTMQLARQARRATAAGDCNAARASLDSVARRDPAYHAALVESPAVASCR